MLLLGCNGGTNATSGVVPEITRAIFEAVKAGRIDEARRWQYRLLVYNDALFGAGDFPEGFRIGVEARGFRMGVGRQPQSEASRERLTRLRRQLEELLVEDRLESIPDGAMASSRATSEMTRSGVARVSGATEENVREQVERVVREVVHVLAERNVAVN